MFADYGIVQQEGNGQILEDTIMLMIFNLTEYSLINFYRQRLEFFGHECLELVFYNLKCLSASAQQQKSCLQILNRMRRYANRVDVTDPQLSAQQQLDADDQNQQLFDSIYDQKRPEFEEQLPLYLTHHVSVLLSNDARNQQQALSFLNVSRQQLKNELTTQVEHHYGASSTSTQLPCYQQYQPCRQHLRSLQNYIPCFSLKFNSVIPGSKRNNNKVNIIVLQQVQTNFLISVIRLIKDCFVSTDLNSQIDKFIHQFKKLVRQFNQLIEIVAYSIMELAQNMMMRMRMDVKVKVLQQFVWGWQQFVELIQPIIHIQPPRVTYNTNFQSQDNDIFIAWGYLLLSLQAQKDLFGQISNREDQILNMRQNFAFILEQSRRETGVLRRDFMFENFLVFVNTNFSFIQAARQDEHLTQFLLLFNKLWLLESKKHNPKAVSQFIQTLNQFLSIYSKYFTHMVLRNIFDWHSTQINHFLENFQQFQPLRLLQIVNSVRACFKIITESAFQLILGPLFVQKYERIYKELMHSFKRTQIYSIYGLSEQEFIDFADSVKSLKIEMHEYNEETRFGHFLEIVEEWANIIDRLAIYGEQNLQTIGIYSRIQRHS